jgi:hypothetical protein
VKPLISSFKSAEEKIRVWGVGFRERCVLKRTLAGATIDVIIQECEEEKIRV